MSEPITVYNPSIFELHVYRPGDNYPPSTICAPRGWSKLDMIDGVLKVETFLDSEPVTVGWWTSAEVWYQDKLVIRLRREGVGSTSAHVLPKSNRRRDNE